jgi:hypothetical protein
MLERAHSEWCRVDREQVMRVLARVGMSFLACVSLFASGPVRALVTTVYAAIDNLVMVASKNPQLEQTVYSNSDLGIGCNWELYYYDYVPYQDFLCARSVVWFDIDTLIEGKTIQSALLRVYPYSLPAAFDTSYSVAPILDEWHFDTVKWSNQLSAGASVDSVPPPVTTVLPMEFDVTSAVQDWADGTRANRGFRIRDTNDLVLPYAIRFRPVGVESLEYWYGTGRRPQLHLEIADVAPPGAVQVSPLVTTSYGLGCTGAGGEVAKTATVTVPEPGAAAAGLGGLVALLVLVARPRRRMPRRGRAACAASMLVAALATGAAHATALPDPFPSRAVQEAAIASDGQRLVLFLRSYLYDWVLPGKDDPGLLLEWNGSAWSAPESITNECHDSDVAVLGAHVAMIWLDDDAWPAVACRGPSCGTYSELGAIGYRTGASPRIGFVGGVPVASYTQIDYNGSRRLFVDRVYPDILPSANPGQLLGGAQCFDQGFLVCPDLSQPAIAASGSSWIAAYAVALSGSPCIGVREGLALPDACLPGGGGTPHDPEIVLVNGRPFVLFAVAGGRGNEYALSALFDGSEWLILDLFDGIQAGAGNAWERIRAVSDGTTVTALYERSDGRLVARAWNGSWHDLGVLAAAGATSSDIALYQGVPYASFVLDGHVHVTPIPEPAPGALTIVALGALAAVARRQGRRAGRGDVDGRQDRRHPEQHLQRQSSRRTRTAGVGRRRCARAVRSGQL